MPLGIDAAGQQGGGHLPRLLPQRRWFLPLRDGVQIDHAIQALKAVLQLHPIAERAEVIAEMRAAARLNAGENSMHGLGPYQPGLMADPPARRKLERDDRRRHRQRSDSPGQTRIRL
jgi:hypothetical protein